MEEVVGVGAGICKAEKERPAMGAAAPRGDRGHLETVSRRRGWCWRESKERTTEWEGHWESGGPFGSPGV